MGWKLLAGRPKPFAGRWRLGVVFVCLCLLLVAVPAHADATRPTETRHAPPDRVRWWLVPEFGVAVGSDSRVDALFSGITLGFDAPADDRLEVGIRTPLVFDTFGWPWISGEAVLRVHAPYFLDETVPWFEVGVGGGYAASCFRGSSCGSGGFVAELNVGGELPFDPHASFVFGGGVRMAFGFATVPELFVPHVLVGVRVG